MAGRKGFNFYVSYYEVLETLSDKERLQYLMAILEKQFNNINPDLSKLDKQARFAYVSQRHSIENQINGFIQKTKEPLTPVTLSTQGGAERVEITPTAQEKGKEEVQYVSVFTFDEFWDLYDKKVGDKSRLKNKYDKISEPEREKIKNHIPKYKSATPDKKFRKDPETYINNKSWNDEIIGTAQQQATAQPKNVIW